ncbi:MAG TPA: hypothetical protein DCZ84_01465 [Candidatus Vogelbacteria bacterium]|uniref:DUF6922 domain-containing protein n=1 Tax=Candidatus Vogelbacteria bacterium RIFOXYD1_FULL_51_18 TaxID=1802440 RepID=A0A1G2QKE9_9BACT|nr:MAG: hypothetical protein UY66_C0013G0002 [Parcubacteria group bacterium GW2011_GWC1_51_35]KKW25362.1 MAG: hypothetical protein UY69_C0041G0008 [Parcubacteria group bacterium GW2011_GWF1_52_5]KKW33974.1 MAG: hypothetical protein UY80_C0027G0001 [Parcubacteria group bacterium GW2011_GWB1_53_43]OHA60431.1 MAG: hypothetical protein A2569_01185 [Candidatus Vogelbacteria bacterium RIFOXYD1_FULL_51_18]HBB65290.1 hypothetical protein [Candidatus Vogelbacteria bacterium]
MKFRQSLFWDANPEKLDPERNAQYIIERILDFGRDDEVRWLKQQYDSARIKKAVEKSRSLRPDTKKLWTLILQKT